MARMNKFKNALVSCCRKVRNWSGLWIVFNFSLAAIIVVAIVWGSNTFLKSWTRHGEQLEVPKFEGKTLKEAQRIADSVGVRLEVIDSIYVREGRGTVDHQNPAPGSMVKKDRRILLVMRAHGVRKVVVPNLIGTTTRMALAELNLRGLQVGRIIYDDRVPTSNNVLEQRYNGREVMPGDSVEAESAIDLVVGLSYDDSHTRIPNVVGKKGSEAVKILHDYYLNVNNLVYEREVDTYEERSQAVVYKQAPSASDMAVHMGIDVTLYLRNEPSENSEE